jgi:hypothetical protein
MLDETTRYIIRHSFDAFRRVRTKIDNDMQIVVRTSNNASAMCALEILALRLANNVIWVETGLVLTEVAGDTSNSDIDSVLSCICDSVEEKICAFIA